jgi:ABC-type multidrug transport system ATPase subunit
MPRPAGFHVRYVAEVSLKLEPAIGVAAAALAIEATDLTKVYKNGTRANDGITLAVRRGEVYGLLGPNGAGKSTFVQQVLGLVRPTSGQVRVFGVDAARRPDSVKRLIGYMPQTAFAMRDLLTEEALYFTARLKGLSHAHAVAQRAELLRTFELEEVRRQAISTLSGGMQRSVGFAMALLGNPPLLLLDEPTNDLDPLRRRAVWEAIRNAVTHDGAACLLVTHNVLEAEHVVDRVALIDAGRVVAEGTPGALKARLGEAIRLEVWLRDGVALSEAQVARLSALGTLRRPRPQQLMLLVPPDGVGATVDVVLREIGQAALADFHVATATLEDVYVAMVGRGIREEDGAPGDGSDKGGAAPEAAAVPAAPAARTEAAVAASGR